MFANSSNNTLTGSLSFPLPALSDASDKSKKRNEKKRLERSLREESLSEITQKMIVFVHLALEAQYRHGLTLKQCRGLQTASNVD